MIGFLAHLSRRLLGELIGYSAQLKYRGHIGDRDTSSAPKVNFTQQFISCENTHSTHSTPRHRTSWSVVVVRRPSVVHNAQRSPKPLGQSKPNFMWNLLG